MARQARCTDGKISRAPRNTKKMVVDIFCEYSLMFIKSAPFSSIINRQGQVVQKVNWLNAEDTSVLQLSIAPPRMEAPARDSKRGRQKRCIIP